MEKRQPDEACTIINCIWDAFNRSDDLLHAACKKCNKIIKTTGGNTTGVSGHARLHNILAKKTERKSKRKIIIDPEANFKTGISLANEQSLPGILSRMVAKGGYAFRAFTTDQDLRACLQARLDVLSSGAELPLSITTIRKYVENFSLKVKNGVKESIQEIKEANQYFSIDFDEWTSIRNRRYVHVTLFTNTEMFWSLGLTRITGNATAERILKLVTGRLEDFGLNSKTDLASIITDGAETMKKIGRISGVQQQLCLAHAVQLAVVDLLYVKKKRKKPSNDVILEIENEIEEIDEVVEEEIEEIETEVIVDEKGGFDTSVEENDEAFEFNSSDITNAIKAVRTVVVKFRSSPLLNEHLQKYVQLETGNDKSESTLVLDVRTRWNSLYKMLDKYWELKECIEKAIIDLKLNLVVTPKQKFIISCVLKTLEPVEETVKALCCRNSNLIKARVAFCELFVQLERHDNPLTKRFMQRLCVRISQRWTNAAGVVKYLHDCSYSDGTDVTKFTVEDNYATEKFDFVISEETEPHQDWKNIFKIPSKLAMKNILVSLHTRVNSEVQVPSVLEDEDEDAIETNSPPPPKKRFKEILSEALKRSEQPALPEDNETTSSLSRLILAEMTLFDKNRNKGTYLQKGYDMLMSVKPTSVESERAFSTAGYFCTKIRSRLGDATLDMLCFLRSFLNNPFAYHDYKLLSIRPTPN